MQKNNPACYECSKGKNKLHAWLPITEDEGDSDKYAIVGARCLHCNTILDKEQAEDVWRE